MLSVGGRRGQARRGTGRAERESFARLRRPAIPNRRGSAAGVPLGPPTMRAQKRRGSGPPPSTASGDLVPADRTYLARLIAAAQTRMSQADAEKRVNDVIVEAKEAADRARKGAAKLAFWLTASLLFGAFAASLAAVEGGQLRDGTWQDRRLIPRPWY